MNALIALKAAQASVSPIFEDPRGCEDIGGEAERRVS
jgi:hypothetical protein